MPNVAPADFTPLDPPQDPHEAERLLQGMRQLLPVVQALSLARDLDTIQLIVRSAARRITNCDGATLVLRDKDQCYYADEEAIAPLWKGKRFPMRQCVSGWAMQHRQAVVIRDIYADSRIPAEAYRPTFVKSLAMVPIRSENPIGAIGNYWAEYYQPTAVDMQLLQALADSTSIAMENCDLYQQLEQRVAERTVELQHAYERIQQLSITDDLTGLHNRRGFYLLGEQLLREVLREQQTCNLLFIDLDGLKQVNDQQGHEAGDALIRAAAHILRSTLRDCDLVARMGGDEFAILIKGAGGELLKRRLQQAFAQSELHTPNRSVVAASIGCIEVQESRDMDLYALLSRADELMYDEKRVRKQLFAGSGLR